MDILGQDLYPNSCLLTRTQYSLPSSVEMALMSASLAVPRERKKLVWQSSWHVKRRSSVITRQQGIQGLGATPWGMTWALAGERRRLFLQGGQHQEPPINFFYPSSVRRGVEDGPGCNVP